MKYFVCILIVAQVAYSKVLPDYASQFTQCRRSDPNLNECLTNSLNAAIQTLMPTGIPELGIDSKDPWNIPFMTAAGDLTAIQVKMVMKNTTLIGWKDSTLKAVRFDPETLVGEAVFNLPWIRMMCEYYSTGQLFQLPLENSAHFDGNFTGFDGALKFQLREVERGDNKYFTIEKVVFKGRVDTAHVKITAIDPAQQPLVSVIEVFFNENDRLVLDTVNPLFRKYSADFFKQWVEAGFKTVPSTELLPY